jgi:outer membrane receptor protein involved in Fe transport
MLRENRRCSASKAVLAAALFLGAIPCAVHAEETASGDSVTVEAVRVNARLNAARDQIQPGLGASVYTLDSQALQALPGGDNASLNQVVLQAPGVVQDSFGQLHVRGEHNGLQFRLNGVILPEGLSVFGQALSPRLAGKVSVITGALPAQYGLRTAGVVDISTKSTFDNAGTVGLYAGSHSLFQPSIEYGFTDGPWNGFVSASWLRSDLGVESPDGSADPLHDHTDQLQGFAYVERVLSASRRLALILGTSVQRFQIPNSRTSAAQPIELGPDGAPIQLPGGPHFDVRDLREAQREVTHYAIASYLVSQDRFTGQVSLFSRYSTLDYSPGGLGELAFAGISQQAEKSDVAAGLQAEGVYRLNDFHTVRSGAIAQFDRSTSQTNALVVPVDANGGQVGHQPFAIIDDTASSAQTWSLYLQDEWALTDQATLNYGLRYDRFNGAREEDQLSPRLNLVWKPLKSTTFHAGYSRYFTPPPFELVATASLRKFDRTSGQPLGYVNDKPYAERADYFDVGAEHTLFRGGSLGTLTVALDTYYKRSKNLIDEGQFGAPIILTPFNYRDGLQYGEELSSTWSKGSVQAYANFAYGMARGRRIISSQFNFSPDDLAYIASHYVYLDHQQKLTGSAGASWKKGPVTLSADMLYGSGMRRDGDVPNGRALSPYTVVNVSASRTVELASLGTWSLRVDVVNLFDKIYEIRDGTGIGVGAPQFGARRGVFVGIARDI